MESQQLHLQRHGFDLFLTQFGRCAAQSKGLSPNFVSLSRYIRGDLGEILDTIQLADEERRVRFNNDIRNLGSGTQSQKLMCFPFP